LSKPKKSIKLPWFYLPFTPVRTAERTFTLADTENAGKYDLMCQRGTVFKWLDGTDYKMACIHSAVYADDVVTFTLMGDTISEGVDMTTMQYFIEKAKTITFTVAGNLPSNATEVAGYFPVPYQIKLLGAEKQRYDYYNMLRGRLAPTISTF